MNLLHIRAMKIVTAGGDLGGASELLLEKNAVGIKATGEIIEHIISDNPNPKDRTEIGTLLEVKGVFAEATLDDLVKILGGTHTANVFTKTQGVRVLSHFDVRFISVRKSDQADVLIDLTYMDFIPEWDSQYEQKKQTYLNFTLKSTRTSEYSIDNSAE